MISGYEKAIDPEDQMDEGMLESLEKEGMALAEKEDRAFFDFAFEFSDKVNYSAQCILMGLMTAAKIPEPVADTLPTALMQDAKLAVWSRCARQAFLDVLAKEAAPAWARTEYVKRHQENLEMQDSWLDGHTDDYRDLV